MHFKLARPSPDPDGSGGGSGEEVFQRPLKAGIVNSFRKVLGNE